MPTYRIVHYVDPRGHDPYQDWFDDLRDPVAKVAILRRIARMELGLWGDSKALRDGIWELRIDVGPGYRVYYALVGSDLVLLTCGGNKASQARDIKRAIDNLTDWNLRNGQAPSKS